MLDIASIDGDVKTTGDGYLTAFARVARTGIQLYSGRELGVPDVPVVRVYRPESEVFHKDAMHSFAHRPVTIGHPSEMVDASNWKQHSVGQTGDEVVRDGQFVRVPLVLMDAVAISRVNAGTRELSMGYTTDIMWGEGKTPDGQDYDAVQTSIRGNHLAVVAAARGGEHLRIGDAGSIKGDTTMADKTLVIDGVSVMMSDTAAQIVERQMARIGDSLTQALDRATKAEGEFKALKDSTDAAAGAAKVALDTANGQIAALQKQIEDSAMTPEKLDVMVKERQAVADAARKIVADDKFVVDGLTVSQIRKGVVVARLGDSAKTMTDAGIEGAFAALAAQLPTTTTTVGDVSRQVHALSRPAPVGDARQTAYEANRKRMSEAWKTGGVAAK